MSTPYIIITVALLSLSTILTRSLPFLIFSGKREVPSFISYLGKALPPAVFAMLLVYCLKNVDFISGSFAIPEVTALAVVVLLHLWKRQMLLSIGVGTVIYMILVQSVF